MSVLEQGIDKLERTRQALADPQSAPELLLHLRGLRRVRDAAALLRQAAAAAAGPSPAFSPQLLPITPASACPELFRGLAELAVGLAECKAASDSRTLPDGLDALLCDRRTGMLRAMVETSPAVGMTLTCLEAREVRTPLAAVAALAVFAVVGDSDDAQRVRCAWGSLHAVLAAVWPDSGSPARLRALERGDWVPPPPSAAGAPADASTDSPGAGPRGLGGGGLQGTAAVGTLAAALAADLASHAPGITLPGLHAAALTIMAGLFAGRAQLGAPQMQQLLVRVHDVPAGAAAGCFQLAHVGQAAGRAGFLSARRLERLAAYMDGAQALAASSQCTHAGFVLAQQEVSFCMQLQQLRGRPEMAWLPPGTSERFLARGRSAVARAAECVMALKLWLQPHKLAREKAALRTMQSELEHAARAAPAPRALPRDLPLRDAERCSHCGSAALHLKRCGACRAVAYWQADGRGCTAAPLVVVGSAASAHALHCNRTG